MANNSINFSDLARDLQDIIDRVRALEMREDVKAALNSSGMSDIKINFVDRGTSRGLGDIKMAKAPRWQGFFETLLASNRDNTIVNISFRLDDYRNIPADGRDPEDWDQIIPGYYLAISRDGILNVDNGTKEDPNIISNATDADDRTLMECFRIALYDYYCVNEKHFHKVHPSWYDWIEGNPVKPVYNWDYEDDWYI